MKRCRGGLLWPIMKTMLRKVSGGEVVAAADGSFRARRRCLVWCSSPTVSGTTVWGAPDQTDARQLVELWEHDHQLRGFDSLLDAEQLKWVDLETFTVVVGYLQAHVARYPKILRRQAVI